jgi:hypothetical protein
MPRTEEPWRYDVQSGSVTGKGQQRVCGTNSPDDGNLIAAAPELLDAFRRALEYNREHQRLEDGHFNAMREAIDKALGK